MSYDPANLDGSITPATAAKDRIRFAIGDTHSQEQLTDAEINRVLAQYPNEKVAAYQACKRVMAKLASVTTVSGGGVSIVRDRHFDQYKATLVVLEREAMGTAKPKAVIATNTAAISRLARRRGYDRNNR